LWIVNPSEGEALREGIKSIVGATGLSPLQVLSDIGCFKKHPMSFCRASAVCPSRISPNNGFLRHRMFRKHPMSFAPVRVTNLGFRL